MTTDTMDKRTALMHKGVRIPNPESVVIGEEVELDRISGDGVTLHAGCRVHGRSTLILAGAQLGREGPVTVENCRIGPRVALKGGYFTDAVFLEGASAGLGSHVREGTILEEQAGIAHTVALKQTLLFPFVTLGSLINFCDIFMAGGTSRQNHSEVGSSYIHFNFTPNQDKATPSLLGDVPKGVMLRQPPIFLGGQGGLVGPCRLAYGTTVAAGSIYRKDALVPGRLLFDGGVKQGSIPFTFGIYRAVRRVVINNLIYLGNLLALDRWYRQVRSRFIGPDFPEALWQGLTETLEAGIRERVVRLEGLAMKMPESIKVYTAAGGQTAGGAGLVRQKQELYDRWPDLKAFFASCRKSGPVPGEDPAVGDRFIQALEKGIRTMGRDYLRVIQGLDPETSALGTRWLQSVVDGVFQGALEHLPSFGDAPRGV